MGINEREDENIYTYNSEKKKNKRKCIEEMRKMWDKESTSTLHTFIRLRDGNSYNIRTS